MKWLACVFVFLGAQVAGAVTFEVDPFNYQMRFERTEDQGFFSHNFLSFAAGASWGSWGVLGEYGSYSARSGSGYANFGRQHEETLLWGRREILLVSQINFVGGIGAGFAQDSVDTHFGDDRSKDHGDRVLVTGLSAGLAYDPIPLIRLALEGRIFFSQGFDPNPAPDLVLRAGVRF